MSLSLKLGYSALASAKVKTECIFSEVWWAIQFGSFYPKIELFFKPEWTKGGPHKNKFWVFLNSEMIDTNSTCK